MATTTAETPHAPVLSSPALPNGSETLHSSKLAESMEIKGAGKQMDGPNTVTNGKLVIKTSDVSKDYLIHGVVHSTKADLSSDPLSATALISPLHSFNWDAASYFIPRRPTLDHIDTVMGMSGSTSTTSQWEAFKRMGPRYPPSLEKLLMDYHHKHSKSWQLVHDMGSGSGLYSPVLAKYFRHVHISDPSSNGLTKSRKAMSAWSAENKRSRGRFTFSCGKAEQGHEAVADRTVDLAIMVESAHLTNPESMIRSAAQSLSTNGTLALVSYSPVCRVAGNPGANEAVQSLYTACRSQMWEVVCGDANGQKQFSAGLDFVPLPPDLFDISKTRRITINAKNEGNAAFQVPTVPGADASDSKVHPSERRQDYSSEYGDEQARGWRQEVGPEFFRSMTTALMGTQSVQNFDEEFKKIQQIVQETSPNGIMVTVEWTVAIVLATRI